MTVVDLRARPGLRPGGGRWLVPPWVAPALFLCAVVLVPWTAFLFLTLPPHYRANHWPLAVASAVLVELPLAALCFWMATNLAHAVEVARPFLQAAGFTVSNNRLVPPSSSSAADAG